MRLSAAAALAVLSLAACDKAAAPAATGGPQVTEEASGLTPPDPRLSEHRRLVAKNPPGKWARVKYTLTTRTPASEGCPASETSVQVETDVYDTQSLGWGKEAADATHPCAIERTWKIESVVLSDGPGEKGFP